MQAAQKSWIAYDANSQFPLENIPFGVYHAGAQTNCCTRIGDTIVDLAALFPWFKGPLFSALKSNIFEGQNLNQFASMGKAIRIEARQTIQALFAEGAKDDAVMNAACKLSKGVKMAMPVFIRDYTDFYSSKNHAYNIGVMFRGPDNAL